MDPLQSELLVLSDSPAVQIEPADAELLQRVAWLGRLHVPEKSLGMVFHHAFAGMVAHTEVVHGYYVSIDGC